MSAEDPEPVRRLGDGEKDSPSDQARRDQELSALRDNLENVARVRKETLDKINALTIQAATTKQQIDQYVVRASFAGATWAEIGKAAGITAQSAHQRWSKYVRGHEGGRPVRTDSVQSSSHQFREERHNPR